MSSSREEVVDVQVQGASPDYRGRKFGEGGTVVT